MSNTTVTPTVYFPAHSTYSTNNFSGLTRKQLNNEYIWFETADQTADKLEKIVIALDKFLWEKLKLIGLEKFIKTLPLYVRLTKINVFCIQRPYFSGKCFKVPHPNPFIDPAIVAHERTHGIVRLCNPLGNQAMGNVIEEMICDIVSVIFNQIYSGENNWSIGERDLSAEKFDDGTLKHAASFEAPVGDPSKDNDIVLRNSEILSRAFFLASKALSHEPYLKETLMLIWFHTAMTLKQEEKTFVGFRNKTIELASSLKRDRIKHAVINAWNQISYLD